MNAVIFKVSFRLSYHIAETRKFCFVTEDLFVPARKSRLSAKLSGKSDKKHDIIPPADTTTLTGSRKEIKMFKISLCFAVTQVCCPCCCHQRACRSDEHLKVGCWKMLCFITAHHSGSGQLEAGQRSEVTRKLCEVWKVIQGLHGWCTLNDRRFAHLIGHFFKAAPNDHLKHHSSHLEALAANMKSILDDFIRAEPVESCLFAEICNEMIGKLVSNGCQKAKYLLSALNSKSSFMMIHLNIILKSKHGFAGLFSLRLFSFLNDFSLLLQRD